MRCEENMREADDVQTTDIPSLLYGKILSHRDVTGPPYSTLVCLFSA